MRHVKNARRSAPAKYTLVLPHARAIAYELIDVKPEDFEGVAEITDTAKTLAAHGGLPRRFLSRQV